MWQPSALTVACWFFPLFVPLCCLADSCRRVNQCNQEHLSSLLGAFMSWLTSPSIFFFINPTPCFLFCCLFLVVLSFTKYNTMDTWDIQSLIQPLVHWKHWLACSRRTVVFYFITSATKRFDTIHLSIHSFLLFPFREQTQTQGGHEDSTQKGPDLQPRLLLWGNSANHYTTELLKYYMN